VPVVIFLALMVAVIFAADFGLRWWRENEWKCRERDRDD
jgi:hypothetical protein